MNDVAGPARADGRPRVVPLHRRAALLLAGASLLGVVSLGWPLVVPAHAAADGAHSADAPFVFLALLPFLVGIVLAEIADRSLDAKAVAVLGILSATGATLRLADPGVAGIELMFFILIPAGRVFGKGFGFVLGCTAMFASALLTGGVGPWLPFQMFAAGWMGLGAGCLPPARGRVEVLVLAAYTAVACLAYGLVTDLWFWPFVTGGAAGPYAFVPGAGPAANLHAFALFYLTTSLGFDLPRAAINTAIIVVLGRPILAALRRASRRAAFDAPVRFAPLGAAASAPGPAP